jgi:parallel beta helix pectate lyase-like protein
MRLLMGLAAMLVVLGLAPPPAPALEIGPTTDLCVALQSLPPGEELVLEAGDYLAGCVIHRRGQTGLPLVIRAADLARRPRLLYPGRPVNLLEVRASNVTIRGLEFWGSFGEADGVRIMSGDRITVEDCRFYQLGGIAVVATHASVQGLVVRRNVIVESHATAMYFGCHDGFGCTISGLVVEGNHIQGVSAPASAVGYGLQVKLNSSGVIRGNVIQDTKGPGIMIYGARDLLNLSVVERNFVSGSRTSSGIVIAGGPVLVRNNVAVGNFEAGIGLENYQHRGLLRGVIVAHNSVYGNRQAGIWIGDSDRMDASVLNNAAHSRSGTPALPPARPGLRLVGNLDCTWLACFANTEGLDFSPFPGSLLVGAAISGVDRTLVDDDFFGTRRGVPASTGAIERPSGPIRPGVWPQ